MKRNLREALKYCDDHGIQEAIFAIPFKINNEDLKELIERTVCRGLVLGNAESVLNEDHAAVSLGYFIYPGGWKLPTSKGTIVYVGAHSMITAKMAISALWSGRVQFVSKVHGRFEIHYLHNFLTWRGGTKIQRMFRKVLRGDFARKSINSIRCIAFIQARWKCLAEPFNKNSIIVRTGLCGDELYDELIRRATDRQNKDKAIARRKRIVLVNAGLAAGGAERQIVNTLIGLHNSCVYESVSLLAEYIDYAPGLDFFLDEVAKQNIEVAQVESTIAAADQAFVTAGNC